MIIGSKKVSKHVYSPQGVVTQIDEVIVEEPLQINLFFPTECETIGKPYQFSITMRTPGNDEQLIIGLLLSEQVIYSIKDIKTITQENTNDGTNEQLSNVWDVELVEACRQRLPKERRMRTTYSSCGLCGLRSIESLALKQLPTLSTQTNWLSAEVVYQIPTLIKQQQQLQRLTGGVHCAAVLTAKGQILKLMEDIGRHNALDKVIGAIAGDSTIDKNTCIFAISSRVSFEMVQKALIAGVSVLVAIGAPSSLAVRAAIHFNLTLIAFTKPEQFNVYHDAQRISSQKCDN
ncbi:formate dehydrogenase accessory sulfurtransferase FdhD [Thalassotalea ganghwensis]